MLEVVRPDSVRSAAAALSDSGSRFLGGGTLLVRNYSDGDLSIRKLVLSDGLGLDRIQIADDRATLGAAVTMAAILDHAGLAALREVCGGIGGPAVRAMATIGGNIFAPSPYGDVAVALLALGAEVHLGEAGTKVSLDEFLSRRAVTRELVTHLSFPLPQPGTFRFAKVTRRRPHGASVLSIAAMLPVKDTLLSGVRIAYGAMAETPVRARSAEAALEGKALEAAAIAAAVAVAGEGTSPPTDAFASAWYRACVLPVHLARLLQR